ncbi:hypothetical protein TNCV_2371391 [Trichonephila clavipes]|nr:hypothetical protein TNCV_2371391 [Trichonephila clavipes]
MQTSIRRDIISISPLMFVESNRCKATSSAVGRSSSVCTSGPQFMPRPMRTHWRSMGFRSGQFAKRGKMSNAVKSSTFDMRTTIVLLDYRVGCATGAEQQALQRM